MQSIQALVLAPTKSLTEDKEFLENLGFKLIHIYPDDEPEVAVMTGHGLKLQLDRKWTGPSPTLILKTDDIKMLAKYKNWVKSPGRIRIRAEPKTYKVPTISKTNVFEISHFQDNESWVTGRAGMLYRDLLPNRLGGNLMVSHIRIPKGGPVPDMVHFHSIRFQLIFCLNGWVKLVYEDQGNPFILSAGECVTQPPEIRHRVLECSDNLEVIEVAHPSSHLTTIDHDMKLPTERFRPSRVWEGQRFCHHKLSQAKWSLWRIDGFEHRDTGVKEASQALASAVVARALGIGESSQLVTHNSDILFRFVIEGVMEIEVEEKGNHVLRRGSAYVVPPYTKNVISKWSANLEFLEVSLPAVDACLSSAL